MRNRQQPPQYYPSQPLPPGYNARIQNPQPQQPSAQSEGSRELSQILQSQAQEIVLLKQQLDEAHDKNGILQKFFHFPTQFHAGCVDYEDRRPFHYIMRQELLSGTNQTFGFAAGEAGTCRATFQMDVDNPTFLVGVGFGLIQTVGVETPTTPLNTYLPLAGVNAAGVRGLDFQWRMSSSSDDRKWQDTLRDSSLIDFEKGYILPIEQEVYRHEILTIEAFPFRAGVGTYRLFASLLMYKMHEKYPSAS